jgi:hypothetical protein
MCAMLNGPMRKGNYTSKKVLWVECQYAAPAWGSSRSDFGGINDILAWTNYNSFLQ